MATKQLPSYNKIVRKLIHVLITYTEEFSNTNYVNMAVTKYNFRQRKQYSKHK